MPGAGRAGGVRIADRFRKRDDTVGRVRSTAQGAFVTPSGAITADARVVGSFEAYFGFARNVRSPGPASSRPATRVTSIAPSPSRRQPRRWASSASVMRRKQYHPPPNARCARGYGWQAIPRYLRRPRATRFTCAARCASPSRVPTASRRLRHSGPPAARICRISARSDDRRVLHFTWFRPWRAPFHEKKCPIARNAKYQPTHVGSRDEEEPGSEDGGEQPVDAAPAEVTPRVGGHLATHDLERLRAVHIARVDERGGGFLAQPPQQPLLGDRLGNPSHHPGRDAAPLAPLAAVLPPPLGFGFRHGRAEARDLAAPPGRALVRRLRLVGDVRFAVQLVPVGRDRDQKDIHHRVSAGSARAAAAP